MTTVNDLFPKPHLTARDLRDHAFCVVIDGWQHREVYNAKKREKVPAVTISFRGQSTGKYLILNKTNAEAIAGVLGTDVVEDWIGKEIAIYPTTFSRGNETYDVIRVRAPKEGDRQLPKMQEPPDDQDIIE